MKPALIRIRHNSGRIDFDDNVYPFFYNPWHYHPEIELTLIVDSYGQRLVGDSVENFVEGDLVLIGSNLPHVWKNDKIFIEGKTENKAKAIVLKFLPDFAGKDLMDSEEMIAIKRLLEETSSRGIKLVGNLRVLITELIKQVTKMSDTERIIQTLKILHHISISSEYVTLASLSYKSQISTAPTNEKDNLRINIVIDYLMKRYHEQINLQEIADMIYMNKNAFCRFFKQKTGKSMVELLSEIRIGQACQRLQKTEESINMVCNEVGFNNISNFNRAFKTVTGTTPLAYKKRLMILQ